MSESQQLFREFIAKYRHDLIGYARDIHGIEFDRNQRPLAEAIESGKRLIAVKSGHGVGKTTVLAVATSWFANTRYPMKVIVTAPTAGQLWDALWPEIRARFRELPAFLKDSWNVLAERIELAADPDNSFVSPAVSTKEKPEAIAGKHSANILLLVDEASGVPDEVFVAGSGSMSGHNAQTVLTGNPTRLTGFFFRVFNDVAMAADWTRFTISALDSTFVDPNGTPRQIRLMFGEDSNEYRVRVLGEFPLNDEESFIPQALVIAAQAREILRPPVRPIWGVDPARYGRDGSGFAERFGAYTEEIRTYRGLDTMQLCGVLVDRYRRCMPGHEPSQILVDVIGIGAGVVDRLGELNLPVVGVNVTEATSTGARGYKLRDELWVRGREVLANRTHRLPPPLPDDRENDIVKQLSQPRYEFRSDGTIVIESKESMKKRGLSSPDKADAWLHTFAGDEAVLIGQSTRWGTAPLASRVNVT